MRRALPTALFIALILLGAIGSGLATLLRGAGERRTVLVQWVQGERVIGTPERILLPGPVPIPGTGPDGSRFAEVSSRGRQLPWRAVEPIYLAAQFGALGTAVVGAVGLALLRRIRRLERIEAGASPD